MPKKIAAPRDRLHRSIDVDAPAARVTTVEDAGSSVGTRALLRALAGCATIGGQIEVLAVAGHALARSDADPTTVPALLRVLDNLDAVHLARSVFRFVNAASCRSSTGAAQAVAVWLSETAARAEALGISPHTLQVLHIVCEEPSLRGLLLGQLSLDSTLCSLLRGLVCGPWGLTHVSREVTTLSADREGGRTVALLQLTDRLVIMFKLLCALCTLPACAHLPPASPTSPDLRALLTEGRGAASLLLDLHDLPKDVHTAAAMTAAECLCWLVRQDGGCLATAAAACLRSTLSSSIGGRRDCGGVPKMALARALLAALPTEELVKPLHAELSLLSCSLWAPLLCGCTSPSILIRTFAFHACETWLHRVTEAVKTVPQEQRTTRLAACGAEQVVTLLRLSLANWAHPNKRMSALAADVFCMFPAYARELRAGGGGVEGATLSHGGLDDAAALTEQALLDVVLSQPERQSSRFGALLRLVTPHANGPLDDASLHNVLCARAMFSACPGLLSQVIETVSKAVEPSAVSSTFAFSLLTASRREMEVAAGLPAGAAGGTTCAWLRTPRSKREGDGAGVVGDRGHGVKERKVERSATAEQRSTLLSALWAGGFGSLLSGVVRPEEYDGYTHVQAWEEAGRAGAHARDAVAQAVADGRLPPALVQACEEEVAHAVVYRAWVRLWLGQLMTALLHPDRDMRSRVAQYVARLLLPTDGANGHNAALLVAAATAACTHPDVRGEDVATPRERGVGAMLTVARVMRTAGWAVLAGEAPGDPTRIPFGLPPIVSPAFLSAALSFPDPEMRVSVLETACCMSSSSVLPSRAELDIAGAWLQDNIACGHVEGRKRGLRALELLLLRMIGSSTPAEKVGVNESDADVQERAARQEAQEQCAAWVERAAGVCTASLYPGAPIDRILLPLEFLDVYTRHLCVEAGGLPSGGKSKGRLLPNKLTARLTAVFATPPVVSAILSIVVLTAFERVKSLSISLLGRLPVGRGWPGYETTHAVAGLMAWALTLTKSPRDREAGAGADVIRLLHSRYAAGRGWTFHALSGRVDGGGGADVEGDTLTAPPGAASKRFILQLLLVLRVRAYALTRALKHVFGVVVVLPFPEPPSAATDAAPMLHGIVASIQAVVQDLDVAALSAMYGHTGADQRAASSSPLSSLGGDPSWRSVFATCIQDVSAVIPLALHVVAGTEERDAGSGGPDAKAKSAAVPAGGSEEVEGEMQLTSTGRADCKPGGPSFTQLTKLSGPVSNSVSQLSDAANVLDGEGARIDADFDEGRDGPLMYDGQDAVGDSAFTAMGDKDGAGREGDGTQSGPGRADLAHMLVVAAWLATREGSKALGHLLTALALPNDEDACPEEGEEGGGGVCTGSWLVSRRAVEGCGDLLLDALLRLKHIGSIANTADAFQTLCSSLLHCGEKQTRLAALPTVWLDNLLARLRGSQQFILRRSAGFSAAFLALLRAEPSGTASLLLRTAMRALHTTACEPGTALAREVAVDVHTAEGVEQSAEDSAEQRGGGLDAIPVAWSWRSQVHALNILRLIFRDASLGEDTPAYGAAGIRVAVSGFTSKSWAVRNSAMLLFAAVTDRAVGSPSRARNNLSALDAMETGLVEEGALVTTTSHFFGRYPTLHSFVLGELVGAVEQNESVEKGGASGGGGGASRVLLPLLLLLTRLQYDGTQGGHPDAADFLPLFLRCRSSRHAYIRRLAALSMATAVLPKDALTALDSMVQGVVAGAREVRCNDLHGACMQMRALCVVMTHSPASARDPATLVRVEGELLGRLKAAVHRTRVDIITLEYARLLQAWEVAVPGRAVRHALQACAADALLPPPGSGRDVACILGEPLLQGLAAALQATHAMQAILSAPTLDSAALVQINAVLGHPGQVVRASAAKAIKGSIKAWTREGRGGVLLHAGAIAAALRGRLQVESNPEAVRQCAKALLRLLCLSASLPCLFDAGEVATTCAAVLRCHDLLVEPAGRAHAVGLLGFVAAEVVTACIRGTLPVGESTTLLRQASRCIAAACGNLRAPTLRLACGEAIARAGLLALALGYATGEAVSSEVRLSLASSCLPCLAACLALLRDGDDEVREGGRAGVVALGRTVTELQGEARVQTAAKELLAACPPVVRGLVGTLPLTTPSGCTNPSPLCEGLLPPSAVLPQYADEARAVILLHAVALAALCRLASMTAEEGCTGSAKRVILLHGTCVLETFVSSIRRLLGGAGTALRRVVTNLREEQEQGEGAAMARAAASGGVFSMVMLTRPMFTEDDDNEHAESVLSAGLGLALYAALERGAEALGAGGDKAASAVAVLRGSVEGQGALLVSASSLIELASSVDLSSLAVPVLLPEGPWLPHAGADDCPYSHIWPATRVAEALLRAEDG